MGVLWPVGLDAQVVPNGPPASSTPVMAEETAALDTTDALSTLLDEQQAQRVTASAATNDSGPAGVVPQQRGFEASLITLSQHDAAAGWQSILTPNVAYRFNRFLSVSSGLPVYAHIGVDKQTNKTTNPTLAVYSEKVESFLLGDTTITGEFALHPKWLDYTLTATMGVPTGDDADGLGAGQVTFSFNNHFEHAITSWVTPDIELGIGDSPNLDDTRLRKSFTTVGEDAHFQAGFTFSLMKNVSFAAEAFEDMPLGTQTVTSVTTNGLKGKKKKVITTSSQKSIGEDNGFLTTLDIPLGGHVVLSGIYNRSLRNHDDTAGFSLTFLLKASKRDGGGDVER